jgi:hypothetical protein
VVDSDESQPLRGVLRTVVDGEERSFVDEQALLALLHRMSHRSRAAPEEPACHEKFHNGDNRLGP